MAGSYGHCVYRDGEHVKIRKDPMELLDHMGEASEAIEEMLIMIDYLSGFRPQRIFEAHQHYLEVSGSDYRQSFEKWFSGLNEKSNYNKTYGAETNEKEP